VVEEVGKNSEAEKAGLLAGDLLLTWSGNGINGSIESPFDLDRIRIEWAPSGPLVFRGKRGAEERSWTLAQGNWAVVARPNFVGAALGAYQRGQELAKAGKPKDAAAAWNQAAPSSEDPQYLIVRVWLTFHSAETLAAAKEWPDADAAYKRALETSSAASGSLAAQLMRGWGLAYRKRNDWTNAEKYFQQAIDLPALTPGSLTIAFLWNELGNIADQSGDIAKAEDCYQRALAIREKLAPESLDFATTMSNLGVVAWRRRNLNLAEERYLQAFKIRQRLAPGSLDLAISFTVLGIIAGQRGELAKADEYCTQALEIREKLVPDSLDVAMSLVNLASVVQFRGDLDRAGAYYRRALSIEERLVPAGSYYVPGTLSGLSLVADGRGDLARSEQYLQKALQLQQQLTPHTLPVAELLNNLGFVVQKRGDLARAQEYLQQALDLRRELAPESMDVAETLNGLGTVVLARGELARAEEYFRQALAIYQKLLPNSPPLADNLSNLGNAAMQAGNLDEAEAYYRQALEIRQTLSPGSTGHAEILAQLSRIKVRKQQLESAVLLLQQAVNALESQAARLGGNTESRSGFRAEHAAYYKDYIDLLITLKQPEAAYQVAERSRARTLLEILAEAHAHIRKGADPALLARERLLRESLTAKSNRRIELLSNQHTEDEIKALNQEIENLVAQYQDVEAQLRDTSPGYFALTQPQPVSTNEVQELLLNPDTVLLEYSLGEKRSYVWALTQHSLDYYELPARAVVEKAAREVYLLLTSRDQLSGKERLPQMQPQLDQAARQYQDAAAALSQMILGPVALQLQKSKRLLVVSDGALQYLPFAALPAPAGVVSAGRMPASAVAPLLKTHEVVNLPSASVLAALRHSESGRSQAPKAVAVFADPVFDRNDPRLKAAGISKKKPQQKTPGADPETTVTGKADTNQPSPTLAAASPSETPPLQGLASEEPPSRDLLTRSMADIGLSTDRAYLSRLPFSRQEAMAILSLTPPGQRMQALDFHATRTAATDPKLAQYRVVHFATHGLLDSEHPELSGLVLSLVNAKGEPQNGFLGLEDVYNMTLSAELVVLSACKTGLGKEIQGEGLLGLTRGFMYAGAPRVVASLWSVNDEATAELMGRFYRAMQKQGMPPASALRQAQMEVASHKRWSDPYFWSGFVIQGEWK
jgi:CHAT domain-containing protein/Tfp pilus assembly protein PilF